MNSRCSGEFIRPMVIMQSRGGRINRTLRTLNRCRPYAEEAVIDLQR